MCKTTIQLLKYYSEPIVTSLHPYIKPQPGTLCRVNTGSTATSDYLMCLVSYLAFDYMHETRHQLRTLQEEVEVVKDDFWIPIQPVKRKGDKNANQRKEDAESISFLSFLYVKRLMCWGRAALTHLVTKHLRTLSCLQTNSMKRGDVILCKEQEKVLDSNKVQWQNLYRKCTINLTEISV